MLDPLESVPLSLRGTTHTQVQVANSWSTRWTAATEAERDVKWLSHPGAMKKAFNMLWRSIFRKRRIYVEWDIREDVKARYCRCSAGRKVRAFIREFVDLVQYCG